MNLISHQNRADLKRRFRKELKRDVTLKFFTTTTSSTLVLPGRECPTCPQAQELLEVTTALSPKLNLETYDYLLGHRRARTGAASNASPPSSWNPSGAA